MYDSLRSYIAEGFLQKFVLGFVQEYVLAGFPVEVPSGILPEIPSGIPPKTFKCLLGFPQHSAVLSGVPSVNSAEVPSRMLKKYLGFLQKYLL